MTISLILPSRNRPEKAHETMKLWSKSSGLAFTGQIECIVSLDRDDPRLMDYHKFCRDTAIVRDNRSAVDAINAAAKEARGDIFVVVSDDFACPDGWALKLIELTKGKTDWIAKTPDGIQKWIITLPIMDRHYYNRFGYIYYPEFLHMFCDTELTAVADLTGRKIELNIPFKHNHYSVTKGEKDAVSIRADATWEQGEKLFLERAKRNFDLINPPGKITSVEYLNYLKSKGIR